MATNTVLARAQSIAPGLYIASQLLPHEVAQAKAAGFRTIINNRPDFEGGPDQPTSAQVEAAARAEGLVYHHLPVPPSGHGDSDARCMYELVQASPQPVLAFCRTGRRSAALYEKGNTLP